MKNIMSEKYYRDNWDRMWTRYGKECNYEKELSWFIPTFEELPEDMRKIARDVARRQMAKKVADNATASLIKKIRSIKALDDGTAVLGYTSSKQEIEENFRLRESFGFCCLVLSDFKKKYGLS